MKKKLLTVTAALAAAFLGLTACGNSADNPAANNSGRHSFNAQDVRFSQDMIVHHRQALTMAKMVKRHDANPQLGQLSSEIHAAQGPEIQRMSGWLKAWGKQVPSASMNAMDHGSSDQGMGGMEGMGDDMPGMMSGRDLDQLDSASGPRFEAMWLNGMISHHRGAIEMARIEQRNGSNRDAVELAKQIETAQRAEISQMKQMLGS